MRPASLPAAADPRVTHQGRRGRDRDGGPVAAPRRTARSVRHPDHQLGNRLLRLPRPEPRHHRRHRLVSTGATTAAFSAALLVSALAGNPRRPDPRPPRPPPVMTAGSVLGVLSLLTVAPRPNLAVFTAGWLLAGVGDGRHLLPARVRRPHPLVGPRPRPRPDHRHPRRRPRLHRLRPPDRRPRRPHVLARHLRGPRRRPRRRDHPRPRPGTQGALAARPQPCPRRRPRRRGAVARSRPFCCWPPPSPSRRSRCTPSSWPSSRSSLERGYTTTQAAWALGLGGAGQTLGRTLYAALARRTGATARTTTLIALGGLTTAALAVIPGPYALLVALSVAAGMVRGNLTLLQATAVTDRWGTTHYGRLSGLLAAPGPRRGRPRPLRRRRSGRTARRIPRALRPPRRPLHRGGHHQPPIQPAPSAPSAPMIPALDPVGVNVTCRSRNSIDCHSVTDNSA